ncbi:tyrosine-type recombinase/integrase [Pseudothauera nasutitermitis]|uniref:tyrosine-type recombinase/integrase n=1 Tax=Pseudothauera nasutitermitis TaxID=2565930 RepID=UPI001E54DAE1|nr:site-specific integrase [Pseudothauera nasutitermitis]
MTGIEHITDKTLRAWLSRGPTDRGIGGGLTFVATAVGAPKGHASWILRYRFGGMSREKVLGRYPDLSLKDARELARQDRARIQQGVDVAAEKRAERLKARERTDVTALAQAWYDRHIARTYKHPEVVLRALRRHINPVIGKLAVEEVRPLHIDRVLTRILDAGAPTVANDALRYLFRMFHFAVKRRWIEANPVSGFEISDAGGAEPARQRWLNRDELAALAKAMRDTPNFGRENELAVWLLLALCVRKMELLSARWAEFDLVRGVWSLHPSRTKTNQPIDIPLVPQVLRWLEEVKVFACNSEYLFPARRRIHMKGGVARRNRFGHVSPDTLNVALRRLPLDGVAHFTVHDMRRTARTHMAALGVDRFVAERALNHKLRDVEGVYNQYDYFEERKDALARWASLLESIARPEHRGEPSCSELLKGDRASPGTRSTRSARSAST